MTLSSSPHLESLITPQPNLELLPEQISKVLNNHFYKTAADNSREMQGST